MKMRCRSFLALMLCLSMLLPLFTALPVYAEETEPTSGESTEPVEEGTLAEDISNRSLVTDSRGFDKIRSLFDDYIYAGYNSVAETSYLTMEYADGIGSLYMIFGKKYGEYTITDHATGQTVTVGQHSFVHEYIDLVALFGTAPTAITLDFANGRVNICEIDVYTQGEVPDTVQKWVVPEDGNIDLLLFSTHDDDPQLFFAGVLPYYAGELGYEVLVAYMTDHPAEPHRIHELLNGLWAVGVTYYPVTESFPDFRLRYDMEGTYATYKALGYPREVLMAYVVEQLRRYKPLVAIGHDINGEYGHGMHMVYTDLLMEAVDNCADPSFYPELAEKYGVWDVPKTYLHLYEENPIVMDWDQPLSSFGGMTAFEVTRDIGFSYHVSQYNVFAPYHVPYTYATEIPTYNPCYYGLYRSTVGEDVEKNDFFENLLTRAQQAEAERLAAEEEARRQAEAERLAAEEEARRQAEAERLAAEEDARRQEEERLKAEQEAALAREAARKQNLIILLCIGSAVLVVLIVLILVIAFRKPNRGRYQ